MYVYVSVCELYMCVVLLCFVVCMTLLASYFVPSASLSNMYT